VAANQTNTGGAMSPHQCFELRNVGPDRAHADAGTLTRAVIRPRGGAREASADTERPSDPRQMMKCGACRLSYGLVRRVLDATCSANKCRLQPFQTRREPLTGHLCYQRVRNSIRSLRRGPSRPAAWWFMMRIGPRLSLGLLLVLTPFIAGYTYWSMLRTTRTYINELKREVAATVRGLVPALENDLRVSEWDQIERVLKQVGTNGTAAAIFGPDGRLESASAEFPPDIIPSARQFSTAAAEGEVEFAYVAGDERWFWRLAVLRSVSGSSLGYLVIGQDWSDIGKDLRARELDSALAGLLLMAVMITIVPFLIRRYVSLPLAGLSLRVARFSNEESEANQGAKDEVQFLTDEFRRLDQQLTAARADVTEKHRRELELERRLERANRLAAIGTLASGLAHEIGNPLGVIRGRAEYLIRSKPSPAKSNEGLRSIVSQIDRISRIVRMLLDYAREHESPRTVCDLRSITEHAISSIETEAARQEVRIIRQLGTEPLMVLCDSDQIQQVIINLAINALDAMGESGGTLRVSADVKVGGAPFVSLIFEDTGTGISPEYQSRIFDPFFTTKEPGKGTGMGLAVSQSIMREHSGEIALAQSSIGTRFIVKMPIYEGELALSFPAELHSTRHNA
jgi:signal transduction histidine kinase